MKSNFKSTAYSIDGRVQHCTRTEYTVYSSSEKLTFYVITYLEKKILKNQQRKASHKVLPFDVF